MASKRYFTIFTRHSSSLFSSKSPSFRSLKSLTSHIPSLQRIPQTLSPQIDPQSFLFRNFSSRSKTPKNLRIIDDEYVDHDDNVEDDDDEEEEEDGEEEADYSSEEEAVEVSNEPANFSERSYYNKDKIQEASDIGYKVVEPLKEGERVFKGYKPAFAVVQVGSHQFKVSNGDCIYVEKLKYCEVNDKLTLNKVLMAGSLTETMIGRPILPDVAVNAVVEEHALDAKVIIFKKKRRKNYRRTKGHRQELTRLRITNIQGISKPKAPSVEKQAKMAAEKAEKAEKVAVAA